MFDNTNDFVVTKLFCNKKKKMHLQLKKRVHAKIVFSPIMVEYSDVNPIPLGKIWLSHFINSNTKIRNGNDMQSISNYFKYFLVFIFIHFFFIY